MLGSTISGSVGQILFKVSEGGSPNGHSMLGLVSSATRGTCRYSQWDVCLYILIIKLR